MNKLLILDHDAVIYEEELQRRELIDLDIATAPVSNTAQQLHFEMMSKDFA